MNSGAPQVGVGPLETRCPLHPELPSAAPEEAGQPAACTHSILWELRVRASSWPGLRWDLPLPRPHSGRSWDLDWSMHPGEAALNTRPCR